MTPTVAPADALRRLFDGGTFTADGFAYELGQAYMHGPMDVPFATEVATETQWCATGEPGPPVTDADTWLEV